MKQKITSTENELMGRFRTPETPKPVVAETKEAVMPSLEEKQLVVNKKCLDEAKLLIGCLQVNKTDWPRFGAVERKAMLGTNDEKSWAAFGDLHLVEDVSKPENTAMRYRHAVIKDGVVYMQPLMKLAAGDDREIKAVAIELCKKAGIMMENAVGRPQKAMFACPVMQMGRGCPMNMAGRCAHLSDGEDCRIAGGSCPLAGPACPLMKAGEGCPMDQWSGCAQLDEDGGCKLQGQHCQLVCEEEEEGEE